MPEVSILLPVHDGARHLAETLESLLAQDHPDFDVLVIDDGSTDETAAIVARAAQPRLRYVRQAHGGMVAALNHGLSLVDCAFVARADADDLHAPARLREQLDFLRFTGAAAVSCRAIHIDEVGNAIGLSAAHPVFDADPGWLPAIEPYLPHPFLFARHDVLAACSFRHAHLAEDADLCWRLAERWPIAMQGAVLGRYRLHRGSVSARSLGSLRVQAYFSQLAALNARRRGAGQAEVPYTATMSDALAAADAGWRRLLALDADVLDEAEQKHLCAAALLKYLDIARWRRIAPTGDDVAEATRALRRVPSLAPANRTSARALVAGAAPAPPARRWAAPGGLARLWQYGRGVSL